MKALPFLTLKVCVINNRVHTIPIEFGTTLDEAVALAVSIAPKWVQNSNLEICFDPAGRLSGATPPTRIFISAMVSADGAVRWPFPSPFVTSERFSQLETVSYSSGTKIVYICGFYLTARHLAEIGGYTCTSPPLTIQMSTYLAPIFVNFTVFACGEIMRSVENVYWWRVHVVVRVFVERFIARVQ